MIQNILNIIVNIHADHIMRDFIHFYLRDNFYLQVAFDALRKHRVDGYDVSPIGKKLTGHAICQCFIRRIYCLLILTLALFIFHWHLPPVFTRIYPKCPVLCFVPWSRYVHDEKVIIVTVHCGKYHRKEDFLRYNK